MFVLDRERFSSDSVSDGGSFRFNILGGRGAGVNDVVVFVREIVPLVDADLVVGKTSSGGSVSIAEND